MEKVKVVNQMKKWLVDFEIISHVALSNELAGQALFFEAPDGGFTAQVSDLKTKLGTLDPILTIQIILEEDGWESAEEKGTECLLKFLDCLALTLNTTFKRRRTRRVIDWTPGLKSRECKLYQQFSDPNRPLPILNEEHLKSVSLFLQSDTDEALGLAMRWYRLALISELPEEAFQYFWFALEILAEREKSNILVPDKCPICQNPLFCQTCNKTAQHRPYPKQAIEELIKVTVTGQPDQFYEIMQKIRHALLHGESREKIERAQKIKLEKNKDDLGRVVWTILFNQLRKNLKEAKKEDKFCILQPSSYSEYTLGVVAHAVLTAPKNSDPENPKIEEFPYPPFNVSMLTREREDSVDEQEHKPIE